jgi:leucyl-tRNA synthetase
VLVPDKELPVVLPEIEDYQPSGDGRSALARATDWLKTPCPTCGKPGERETDTLDTYICSSWYMLRYFDPTNEKKIFDSDVVNKWMPIDFYNGADHATAHMIYARFITRFFYKQGLVDNPEPFKKFLFNGKITAHDGQMFSKSKGNGIDPLDIINDGYGADALRTYLMFASPLELWTKWDPQGVPGAYRFLSRIWGLVQEFLASTEQANITNVGVQRTIHQTIKKVTEDVEQQKYNTAIAAMMQCVNELYKAKAEKGFGDKSGWRFALESLLQLVAPFAPYISEELWHDLGHTASIHIDNWPTWDEELLKEDSLTIVIQVNGKVRATLLLPADATKQQVAAAALADAHVQQFVSGEPKRTIYIPGRLMNIVV